MVVDGVEPLRAFGMAGAHVVAAAVGMAEEGGGHAACLSRTRADFRVTSRSHEPTALAPSCTELVDQISTIIVGKRPQIDDCVACLLAGGHLLIEDVPGVGKTTLAHALAVSLGLRFSRVQFTADLMPTDLVGVSVYERSKEAFVFHPGPVFAQVLLADEINRAGPKTQSALLEAMEEQQVTVDGETRAAAAALLRDRDAEPERPARHLPAARVAARPLPDVHHARLPRPASERALLAGQDRREAIARLQPVMTPAELVAAQQAVRRCMPRTRCSTTCRR